MSSSSESACGQSRQTHWWKPKTGNHPFHKFLYLSISYQMPKWTRDIVAVVIIIVIVIKRKMIKRERSRTQEKASDAQGSSSTVTVWCPAGSWAAICPFDKLPHLCTECDILWYDISHGLVCISCPGLVSSQFRVQHLTSRTWEAEKSLLQDKYYFAATKTLVCEQCYSHT